MECQPAHTTQQPGRHANHRIPPNPTDKQNVGFWVTTLTLHTLRKSPKPNLHGNCYN